MGRLERILRELREQVEKITDDAPAGPGELDFARLDDEELERLEALLARVGSEAPRQETRPREKVLAGKQNPETWRRHWDSNPGATPPPERRVTGRLSEAERAEANTLLRRATVPEGWEGEEG